MQYDRANIGMHVGNTGDRAQTLGLHLVWLHLALGTVALPTLLKVLYFMPSQNIVPQDRYRIGSRYDISLH